MASDPATLQALAKSLNERADDLIYVGRKLGANAEGVNWTCAKAERYRAAMRARETEFKRVAAQLHELAVHLKHRAAQAQADVDAAAAAPGP